ncbi:MAG: alkaline phosphatase family protein [Acidobacteriota bacterium]|nr:alkaline phosphatase family protein [Acidobacteriota bacterium]
MSDPPASASSADPAPRVIRPVVWLLADAAVAAWFAGAIEVLLLFILSPDRPLTGGGFLAAAFALLPQILVVFVLTGPALVLVGLFLSFGRSTRAGLSTRYILRIALLDAVLLLLAAWRQWLALGEVLPGRAQVALGLTLALLGAAAVLLALLVLVDLRVPGGVTAPWVVAVALGLCIGLAVAAQIRRVRHPGRPPVEARETLHPRNRVLLVEIPALGPEDLSRYLQAGLAPSLERLAADHPLRPVEPGPLPDPIALHATLITGQPPRRHGIFGAVRYQPANDSRSFAVFPRGLFLRPLVHTRLWRRLPVSVAALRAHGWPEILAAAGLEGLLVGDPLGWPGQVPAQALGPGTRVGWGRDGVVCPDPGEMVGLLFDEGAEPRQRLEQQADRARQALAADLCALEIGKRVLADTGWAMVHLRLAGYESLAFQLGGYRAESPAFGVGSDEISVYGKALARYFRLLEPGFRRLLAEVRSSDRPFVVALVSPVGLVPRYDLGRVAGILAGFEGPTATHAGGPPGVLLLAGTGDPVRGGGDPASVASVLPALLEAIGLPADGAPAALAGGKGTRGRGQRDAGLDARIEEMGIVPFPWSRHRGRAPGDRRDETAFSP